MDFEHPPIEEPLGWQELYNILVKTEKLYEKVINKFKRNDGREGYSGGKETEGETQPDFLPPVALGILQARLNSEQRKRNAAFTECGTEADVGESHMSVLSMLETRLRSIQRRHITVLVIGEYNAGKSTFLNILLGGRYLPVDRGKVTMLVCDVRHCTDRRAELIIANDRNTKLESESVPLSTDVNSDGWETVRNSIKTKKYGDKDLRRVIIHWPIPAVDKMLLNVKSRPRRPQTSVIEIPQPYKPERQGSPSPPTEPKELTKDSEVDSATSHPTEPKILMKGSVDSATSPPAEHKELMKGSVDSATSPSTEHKELMKGSVDSATSPPTELKVLMKGSVDSATSLPTEPKELMKGSVDSATSPPTEPKELMKSSVDSATSPPTEPKVPMKGSVDSATSPPTEPNVLMKGIVDSATSPPTEPKVLMKGSVDSATSPPTEPNVLMKGSVDSATSPPTEPKVLMKGSVDSATSPPTEPKVLMKGSVDSATSPPTEPKILMKDSVDSAYGSLSTDDDSQTFVKQPFPTSDSEKEDWTDGSTSLNAERPVLSVSFLDRPGINHEDATGIREVLDEYDNSNAAIIILNTADDDGIKANGIKRVLFEMRERDACSGKLTDGDSMLFIANKADNYTKEDDPWKNRLRNEVLKKLTQECNWLNVSSAHVIPVESEKINTEISKQKFTQQKDMYRCIQMFLRKAYRADLEQNMMWLMSLLQHSRSIVESNLSPNIKLIKHDVDNWKKESLAIQNIPEERKQREKTELIKLGCSLQRILEGISVQEVSSAITLQTIDSAVRYKANINWSSVSKDIDKLVCEMLTAKQDKEIQLMGEEYERTVSAIYSEERGRLKKLKESVFGLKKLNSSDYSIVEAALRAMAGPILSMSFRISPIFFPAMFLFMPAIPLGLIIYSIYESFSDAQQESERKSFKDDKLKFVQERVAKIHKDVTKMLPNVIEKASEYEAKRIVDSCLQISQMLDELDSNSMPIDQACKDNIIRLIFEVADLFFGEVIDQIDSCGVTMSDEHNVHCWKMKQSIKVTQGRDEVLFVSEEYSSEKTKYMLEYEHCVLLRQMSRGTCRRLVRILECLSEAPGRFVVTLESGFRNLSWLLLRQPHIDPAIQRRLFQHTSRECQQCIKSIHAMGIVHGHLKVSSFVMVHADRDNENLDPGVTDEVDVVSNLQFILKLTIAEKNESGLQETIDDHFVAPEVKIDSSRTTTASDVYSLGVICVYLWHGARQDLFGQRNMAVFSKRPIDCVEADEFITKCLEPNPRDRWKLSKK